MPQPRDFDAMADVSRADQQLMERARVRQQAAWEGRRVPMSPEDEERKRLSDEHRAKTMASAGITPAEISRRLAEEGIPAPPADAAEVEQRSVQQGGGALHAGVAGVPTKFSVMKAHPEASVHELPPAGEQYAPDWKAMKERISSYDGTWIVENFEFLPDPALILGFFGKEGWDYPDDALKEQFEVIVKNGRVFRTDPE